MKPASPTKSSPDAETQALTVRRHLRLGWLALLAFLVLGLVLEALHGFKVQFYLNLTSETRRLMWTLAHAHGTLLGLVNLGFAVSNLFLPQWSPASRQAASRLLFGATLLLPGGFFLGGLWLYGSDPGLGILLVPVGALLLLAATWLTAVGLRHFQWPGAGMRREN